MLVLGIGEILLLMLAQAGLGAILGFIFANNRQKQACGDKTPAELVEEFHDYRGRVAEHFQATAGLLGQMTVQYRAVYEHMADGAQHLCDPTDATPQIASLRAALAADLPPSPTAVNPSHADAEQSTGDGTVTADGPAMDPDEDRAA